MNHSSGFADISQVQLDVRCHDPRRDVSPDELIATGVAQPRADFAPGGGYEYSSVNTIILGRILEAITGETYGALLQARLLSPAEAHETQQRWRARRPTSTATANPGGDVTPKRPAQRRRVLSSDPLARGHSMSQAPGWISDSFATQDSSESDLVAAKNIKRNQWSEAPHQITQSQQVQRISARRERISADRHGRSGEPLGYNPRKQRENPASPSERRTGCVGRLAEGMGLTSNLLHLKGLISLYKIPTALASDHEHRREPTP